MAPHHPAHASQTTRLPPKRFLTHILLSAIAISIPHLLYRLLIRILLSYFPRTQLSTIQLIIFLLTFNLTNILGLAFRLLFLGQGTRNQLRSESYGSIVSSVVAALHGVILLLGRYVNGGFTARQSAAVHFCAVFWVLEECEGFWAYGQWRYVRRADEGLRFEYLREPVAYRAGAADFWWYGGLGKECLVGFAECVVFQVVCGVAACGIKSVVNPDPECGLLCSMVGGMVLFGGYPASVWEAVLGLALLRVVRQANYAVGNGEM
ncbi:hypothetical protein COCMIDRAFT_26614 [Bipolaris oryzae ATCC 44560]|uniref:Uncharacterized protein n=1 Tax=Bipolaris oryzae ATCC 44560 TaxID=930090 RepID=W6ZNS1_COCMI|nr:uncharacterized protein COCMIDRAFT_26614 [Bipolaris oryzae ATCC 44560]EUC45206.1 hypothetical protein COCMIDRAFT_26614 [Bipolaris oryzae ATCC 44560]